MSKPSWRGIAVGGPAERDRDLAQRPVVHVDHAAPGDAAHVEAELVAVVDVVVDQRRAAGCCASAMAWKSPVKCRLMSSIGHDLRVAAAGRAALHAEHRAERGLAQADHRLLADAG